MAVVVGLARSEVLANYYSNVLRLCALAGGITFLILIVMALSVSHHRKLNKAHDWLRRNEMFLRTSRQELKATLESIDQGLLMVDAKEKSVLSTSASLKCSICPLNGLPGR